MIETILNLDGNTLLFIQQYLRSSLLTPVFKIITSLGNGGLIWIAISLLLIINNKTRKVGFIIILALLGSLLINNIILKNLISRPRPFEVIEGLQVLISKPHDFSFPSGHTASSFAAAFVIYKNFDKRYGISALILALLIAISRMYIGVHYPSDVILGAVSGILIGVLAQYVWDFVVEGRFKNLIKKN